MPREKHCHGGGLGIFKKQIILGADKEEAAKMTKISQPPGGTVCDFHHLRFLKWK